MPKPTSTWKDVERRVAKRIGGKRVPLSGENNGFASGDVDHPRLFVEVKHRKSIGIARWFEKTEEDKRKALGKNHKKKETVLVLHEKNKEKFYALVGLEVIAEMDAMCLAIRELPREIKDKLHIRLKQIEGERENGK